MMKFSSRSSSSRTESLRARCDCMGTASRISSLRMSLPFSGGEPGRALRRQRSHLVVRALWMIWKSIKGWMFLNLRRMSGSSDDAARTLKTIVERECPATIFRSWDRLSRMLMIGSSLRFSAMPASLSCTRLPRRWNSGTSSSFSSDSTALLIEGCEMYSSSAALEKFSYLATVMKYRR